MDWKGGMGTSSRLLPESAGGYAVGILVQTNFGGLLRIKGRDLPPQSSSQTKPSESAGSIMMILATDAPLSDRNLTRLAARALSGLARAGASMSNGSGDYAIAFSVAEEVRRTPARRQQVWFYPEVPNALLSPLFQAAIEASEEAIYNSLCMAETMLGFNGYIAHALPLELLNTA
jgi:D-aminopeptidase